MGPYAGAVPGAAVAVLGPGSALRRAYGLANLESGTPASSATNYRLASITKQFTAAAVLLLAEDGVLSIDDRVRRWLPTLPEAADDVTLRHLLTHSSGLVDFEELMAPGIGAQLRDADVLRLAERENRRHFTPGSRYRYSNSGYALLALVVERASRRRYASFLRERIFEPLGMRRSVAYESGYSVVAHRAYGYSLESGSWRRTDQSLTSATLGDGGIYSSLEDLARWDAALDGGRLLRVDSVRAAFAPAIETDVPDVHYGFGWRISGAAVWHSGESVGFRNVILRFLQPRCTVIVLTNRSEPSPYPTALAIAQLHSADIGAFPATDTAAGPDAAAHPLPR